MLTILLGYIYNCKFYNELGETYQKRVVQANKYWIKL